MGKKSGNLKARLVVAGGVRAIEFYQKALGAEERARHVDPGSGRIVQAELAIGDDVFFLTEEDKPHTLAPTSLGGSPVILFLQVGDADAVGARMENGGATVIFPIADQPYGRHEGRLRDPFGHLWIISTAVP